MPKKHIFAAHTDNAIVNMMQETKRESATNPKSYFNPWNSDDLYQKRGDYGLYEEMINDDQISICMQIKKDLVVGSGFDIVTESEDDAQIREEIEISLTEVYEGNFEDALYEIITAYEYGFSVTEKIFKKDSDNGLKLWKLKTRDPVDWLFHQDEYGNIERYEQQGSVDDVDPIALMHYINCPKFDNPYGTSDLRAAYMPYLIKRECVKYYAIFMEKASSPVPIGKYKRGMAEDQDVTDFYNTLKKLQQRTAMVIPDELEVDFLQANSDGEVFRKAIGLMNMLIGRCLFVPDLLGFQGGETGGGSQALGREQMVIFFKHIAKRRRTLEQIVNNHIIRPLVKWNFGDVEKYPKFKLKPISDEQATEQAKLWLEAVKGRAFQPTNEEINHFRSIVNFPMSDAEDMEKETDPMDEPVEEMDELEMTQQQFVANFQKRTDFARIERQLDSAQDTFEAEAKQIVGEIFDKLTKKMKRYKNIPQEINLDKPLMRKLNRVLLMRQKDVFNNSLTMAQEEIQKSNFTSIDTDQFLHILENENLNFISDWEYKATQTARIEMIAAIKDGKPISSAIDKITTYGIADSFTSIERYSRTKFTEVMNRARSEHFNKTGVVTGFQYSAILDGRTTEICRSLHNKKFKAGSEPIPPLHFNCRSVLVPITMFEEFTPDETIGGKDIDRFIEDNKGKGFAKQ